MGVPASLRYDSVDFEIRRDRLRSELQTAIGIARLAVALADSRQGADDVQSKQGIDIVTAADLAVEDLIRKHMANTVRAAVLANAWNVWLFHSTVSYAYLAMGRIAGLLQFSGADSLRTPNVHCAAGCLIAQEAGAVVTDMRGAAWGPTTQSFSIAANEILHRQLIDLQRSSIGSS